MGRPWPVHPLKTSLGLRSIKDSSIQKKRESAGSAPLAQRAGSQATCGQSSSSMRFSGWGEVFVAFVRRVAAISRRKQAMAWQGTGCSERFRAEGNRCDARGTQRPRLQRPHALDGLARHSTRPRWVRHWGRLECQSAAPVLEGWAPLKERRSRLDSAAADNVRRQQRNAAQRRQKCAMETLTRCVRRWSAASVAAWRRESARRAERRRRSAAAAEETVRRGLLRAGVAVKGRRGGGARGRGRGAASFPAGLGPLAEHEDTELRVRILCRCRCGCVPNFCAGGGAWGGLDACCHGRSPCDTTTALLFFPSQAGGVCCAARTPRVPLVHRPVSSRKRKQAVSLSACMHGAPATALAAAITAWRAACARPMRAGRTCSRAHSACQLKACSSRRAIADAEAVRRCVGCMW